VTTEVFFVNSVARAEHETSHECATAPTARHSILQLVLMQDLLRQLDPDYYRSALLLLARTELEQLRQAGARDAPRRQARAKVAAPDCGGISAKVVR
jgi:hypothetical protein